MGHIAITTDRDIVIIALSDPPSVRITRSHSCGWQWHTYRTAEPIAPGQSHICVPGDLGAPRTLARTIPIGIAADYGTPISWQPVMWAGRGRIPAMPSSSARRIPITARLSAPAAAWVASHSNDLGITPSRLIAGIVDTAIQQYESPAKSGNRADQASTPRPSQ